MAEETGSVSRLAELARDIKIAMLTTVDEDGHFISRADGSAGGGVRRRSVVLR